jgi:putative ABC transport system permease protein
VGLPIRDYPDGRSALAAHHAILDGLSALPGITSVSATSRIPLSDQGRGFSSSMRVEGRSAQEPAAPIVAYRAVAGGYFQTIGTRLIRGRGIDRADVDRGALVAVVNEALVKAYFPQQDPVGARVRRGTGNVDSSWLTIVGVVPNMPIRSLTEATTNAAPELYLPMSVSGTSETANRSANGPPVAAMSYVVRTAQSPLAVMASVRRTIGAVDRNLPIAEIRTLQELVDAASAQMAFTMALIAIAATVALLLGVVGIYGALSYVVSQRTNEIGLRMALGADPQAVARMIVRQGGVVALAGIAVGLTAALAGNRLIETLLYDVSPRDPGIVVAATLGLFVVALLACWVPARRAARLDPLIALRAE